jgi:hypothetical protein
VSGPLDAPDIDQKLAPVAAVLRSIAAAMGAGIALLVAVDAFLCLKAVDRVPTPQSLRTVNLLTMIAMAYAFGGIVVSELLWRSTLRGATAENVGATASKAFIIRSAVREGAALLGAVVVLLAATGGVLRLYPAYWANLVPAALFWSYLWAHWPTVAKLKAELAAVLGGDGAAALPPSGT